MNVHMATRDSPGSSDPVLSSMKNVDGPAFDACGSSAALGGTCDHLYQIAVVPVFRIVVVACAVFSPHRICAITRSLSSSRCGPIAASLAASSACAAASSRAALFASAAATSLRYF